jgi:regulator of sirC expression with transglutaminase-like and TPR domain
MATITQRFDLSLLQQSLIETQEMSAYQISLVVQEILSRGVHSASRSARRVDFLFHEFQARNPGLSDGLEAISALNDYLYEDQGYVIVTEDKCTLDDYFIGKVLENRTAAPLAFAIIYRELATRLNLAPINYVNFPSNSLIKILYNHQLLFVDPAEKGRLLSVADLQKRLYNRYGQSVVLNSSFLETPSESHVANRVLTKLKNMYFDLRRWDNLLGVLDLLVWLNPAKMHELKERGLLLYQLGHYSDAKHDLNRFVTHSRPSPETDKLRQLVTYLENPKITPLYE